MNKKIAVVPGDGIGPEVIDAGMKVLTAVTEHSKLPLEFVHFNWNADTYLATGISMPRTRIRSISRTCEWSFMRW